MSDLNSVVLVGRLTRDPELRYTPKGAAVCELSVATNRRFTTKDGEKVEEVAFVDVVLWNRVAENAAQFLLKGRQVAVCGQLVQERWEDKESGKPRSKIRVQAQTLQFLGGGSKDEETSDTEVPTEVPLAPEPLFAPEVPSAPAPSRPGAAPSKGRAPAKR